MIRNLSALLALLCHAIVSWASIDLRDDSGRELHLARPAQRIITLSPHATELLYAAGAGTTLIATVEFSDFPPAARRLPGVLAAYQVGVGRGKRLEELAKDHDGSGSGSNATILAAAAASDESVRSGRARRRPLHRLGGLPGARWRRLRRVGAAAETTRSVMKVAPAGQW